MAKWALSAFTIYILIYAGYTANISRGRLAGAEMRVFTISNLIILDGTTDQQTDQAFYRITGLQLKSSSTLL